MALLCALTKHTDKLFVHQTIPPINIECIDRAIFKSRFSLSKNGLAAASVDGLDIDSELISNDFPKEKRQSS